MPKISAPPIRRAALAVALLVLALPAGAGAAARDGSTTASKALIRALRHVTPATLDAAGADRVSEPVNFPRKALTGPPLTRDGKPEVLAAGLAWCPHCAANSWALALALGRFGALRGVRVIDSGTYYADTLNGSPGYSHTKGLSFYRATYRSRFISFRSLTVQDRQGRPLQPIGDADRSALSFSDGSFPAINVGGRVGATGSGYSPEYLQGRSALGIARALSRPTGAVGRRIDGLANFFTAAICRATSGQPARVCATPAAAAGAGKLP